MNQDEIIVQIVTTPNGQIIGLSNDGKVYLYENKKWTKM